MRERTGKEVERKKIKWPDIVVHHNKTIKALAADPFLSVFIFYRCQSVMLSRQRPAWRRSPPRRWAWSKQFLFSFHLNVFFINCQHH